MAYKIMQKDDDGVLREVVIRGEPVYGSDMDPGNIELKDFDDNTRSFVAIGSTGNSDRSADIVDQKGWELENFLKNPVGMWVHDYRQLPIFQIRDMDIKTRSKKMSFKPHFDDYEFADKVYRSYKKGFMRAFSVGFIPLEYVRREEEDMTEDEKTRAGWFGGRHFKRQELLEISAVPIPANPEALASMKSMDIPVDWVSVAGEFSPHRATLNDGSIWIPINNVSRFVSINTVKIDNIKVVSGKLPDESASSKVIAEVIGYIFPKGYEDEQIVEWLTKNNIPEEKAVECVAIPEQEPTKLEMGEEGIFAVGLGAVASPLPDVVEEPDVEVVASEDAGGEDNNDHVESTVDNAGDKFDIIPESVEVQDGELMVNLNLGSFKIGKDMLEGAGLRIEEGKLITTSNRRTLEEACNMLAGLLRESDLEVSVEPEPEQAQEAQNVDEGEDFAVLLTAAEELKADKDAEIEVDLETFRDVLSGVLKEELGDLVKSSVSKNLKQLTGDLE